MIMNIMLAVVTELRRSRTARDVSDAEGNHRAYRYKNRDRGVQFSPTAYLCCEGTAKEWDKEPDPGHCGPGDLGIGPGLLSMIGVRNRLLVLGPGRPVVASETPAYTGVFRRCSYC